MKKFLLCRPRGGLNDTLCQIQKCWKYCEMFNRTLIIDTTRSGIFINFSELFDSKIKKDFYFELSQDLIFEINNMESQIKEIDGQIDRYNAIYTSDSNYILEKSSIQITIDFDLDYKETLLVYEQCGGGTESLELLEKLKLKQTLKQKFLNSRIEGEYESIHIRNTDYKTDYKKFLNESKDKFKGKKILICSDDREVIDIAKNILSKSIVISGTTNNFTKEGQPLHNTFNNFSQEQKIIVAENSIIDLLLLADSNKIHHTKLSGYNFFKVSGYTKLATNLNLNRKILDELINS